MEWIYENIVPRPRYFHKLMTSCERVEEDEFLRILSTSDEFRKFANELTSSSYPDLFLEIIKDEVGLNRVMSMLGISDMVDTILLYPVMSKFSEIMTHERGKVLASRVLDVCNIHERNMLCHVTYRHILVLAHDENGCELLKDVITKADDLLKDDFLQRIAEEAHSICRSDLGISLFQHVLNLEYTKKTTEDYDDDDTRLHELMAEFDEVLSSTSDDTVEELHKLALKLTSDPDLFVDCVETERGSLMLHVIIGKSEKIDRVFFEAIKQRFTDVSIDDYGYYIMIRTGYVLEKRGDSKVLDQIHRLIGYNALCLTTVSNVGNALVQDMINRQDMECTKLIASALQCHYIELSFSKHGSTIVKKLLGDVDVKLPLIFMVMEIVKCDEDTLVRLAKDEYGNQVLKETLEVAKEHRADLFDDLVDKIKPLLDRLRGSFGCWFPSIFYD